MALVGSEARSGAGDRLERVEDRLSRIRPDCARPSRVSREPTKGNCRVRPRYPPERSCAPAGEDLIEAEVRIRERSVSEESATYGAAALRVR